MFGESQKGFEMQLTDNDVAWMPADKPDYLLVLRKGQRPPRNRREFQDNQESLLERLLAESNPGEVQNGNLMLENRLADDLLSQLPSGLLTNPATPRCLVGNPSLGSKLHEWLVDAEDALKLAPAPPEVAKQEAQDLSLESFLDRLA